jgi:outer membrane protein
MKKILIGISALLLCFAPVVKAQKAWTLEDCIKYAQEKNITVKRKELSTKTSKNDLLQSKLNVLPSVNAGGSHNISSGRYLNTDTYTWENIDLSQDGYVYASSDVTIFNGLQNYNYIQKSKFDLLQSLSELEKAKNDIGINVATAYLQVLYTEELVVVAQSQFELSKLQVERSRKLMEVGNSSRGSLLEIQAQAAREQVSLTNAENNRNIAYLNLTQMLELDSIGDFKIQKPDTLVIEGIAPLQSVRDIYNQALLSMPEIKGAEYLLSSSEKQLAISKGKLSPSLTLSGSISSNYYENRTDKYSYIQQIKENPSKELSLNLSIPIFNKYSTRTQISNSKILVYDAEYNLAGTKKDLYKSIQQAHADAVNAFQNYLSRKESVLSSEEAFKYMQQKYDVGLSSAVDYNTAKTDLLKAKSDLVQSKYEYVFKTKILDFYRGAPLKI